VKHIPADQAATEPTAESGPEDHARRCAVAGGLDRAWRLLPDSQRRLLRRLSVFAGGWSLDAASQVCTGDGVDPAEISALLTSLRATSLIGEVDGDPVRYQMVSTVSSLARRKLDEAGDCDWVARRHALWALSLAEAHAGDATFVVGEKWLGLLDPDVENLRAALAWARGAGDTQIGVRLVLALARYWALRGPLDEAADWASWAVSHGSAETSASVQATVARRAAVEQSRLGDAHGARALADHAAALFRTAGNAGRAAVVGHFVDLTDDPRNAIAALDDSVERARSAAEVRDLGHLLWTRGQAKFFVGRLDGARRDFEECVRLGRSEGRGEGLLVGLLGLARVGLATGRCSDAAQLLADAGALAERADDRSNQAMALGLSGELSRVRGQYARSATSLKAAIRLDRAYGESLALARDLLFLGRLNHALGNATEAHRLFGDALSRGGSPGLAFHKVRCLLGLAATEPAGGDVPSARTLGEQAWAIAAGTGDRQAAAGSLQILARLDRGVGSDRSSPSAVEMCRNSLRLYAAIGDLPGLVSCLEDAAALFVDRGWFEPAGRLLGATEALRATGGYARAPVDRGAHRRTVGAVASALGADSDRVRIEGRTLSWEDAVATACDSAERGASSPQHGGGLTPTEREVVPLVAGGLTNAETAARLFISRRTVDTHLAHIYRKLGIHSRDELARWSEDSEWAAMGPPAR